MKFFPGSTTGKISAWLLLVSVALFLLFYIFGELVPIIPEFIINVLGPAPLLGFLVAGVLALLLILKRTPLAENARGHTTGERSILLYIAVAIALLELVMFALIFIFSE